MSAPIETDVAIIGAGPIGLFAVFELGLLDLKCHLVDILDRPGGQCTELYPEKPIYDIPGLPIVTGQELTNRLLEQVKPFNPQFHFGEMATALEKLPDGRWKLKTDAGTEIIAPVVVVAAGAGSFVPKRPPVPGIEAFENAGDGVGVHYAVRKMETFRGKNILIAGGGDSALDWTINLAPARQVADPGASPRRLPRRRSTASTRCASWKRRAKSNSMSPASRRCMAKPGKLTGVTLAGADKSEWQHEIDAFLPFFGLDHQAGADRGVRHQPARKSDPGGHGALRKPDAGHLRHRRHQHLSRQAEADIVRLP